MAKQPQERSVDAHYGRRDLGEAIVAGLRAAGKRLDAVTPDDLAPVDHFHIRGKVATLELARLAGITHGIRVLDVGGGIGGAARTLAGTFGCVVEVLDLTAEYTKVGEMLTGLTGLSDRVTFRCGSALEIPEAAGSFDRVWTEHSSMNIADKERLYAEIYRVIRPGGRLALYEIMAGPVAPIHLPVPWARDPSISFLRSPDEIRTVLMDTGFQEVAWVDVTDPSLTWLRERVSAIEAGLPPLGMHLLLGDDFPVMFRNVARNIEENRIKSIQGVFERP